MSIFHYGKNLISEYGSAGKRKNEKIKWVEALMMDLLKERMVKCKDEDEMGLLFEAAYLLHCSNCEYRYKRILLIPCF